MRVSGMQSTRSSEKIDETKRRRAKQEAVKMARTSSWTSSRPHHRAIVKVDLEVLEECGEHHRPWNASMKSSVSLKTFGFKCKQKEIGAVE